MADVDDDLRWQWQPSITAQQLLEDFREGRNHDDHNYRNHDDGHNDNDDRVHHRAFDVGLQLHGLFNVNRQSLQDVVKNTARFACCDHIRVEPIKDFRLLFHRGSQCAASFDIGLHATDGLRKKLVWLLCPQNVQALHQRQPRINHYRELFGEYSQFFRIDALSSFELRKRNFASFFSDIRDGDLLAFEQAVQRFSVLGGFLSANIFIRSIAALVNVSWHDFLVTISLKFKAGSAPRAAGVRAAMQKPINVAPAAQRDWNYRLVSGARTDSRPEPRAQRNSYPALVARAEQRLQAVRVRPDARASDSASQV